MKIHMAKLTEQSGLTGMNDSANETIMNLPQFQFLDKGEESTLLAQNISRIPKIDNTEIKDEGGQEGDQSKNFNFNNTMQNFQKIQLKS